MATLETIRTRAGVLISIVIGIALVSFIVNPNTLTMALSMFSDDNNVGRVRGNAITFQEYDNKVNRLADVYKAARGGVLSDTEMKSLREEIWSELIAEYIFVEEAEKIGITVTDTEVAEAMMGPNPHQEVISNFTNEQGQFLSAERDGFYSQVGKNPLATEIWLRIEDKVRIALITQKYWTLDNKSVFVSSAEADNALEAIGKKTNFSYVLKEYASIADEDIKLTESDIKKVYDRNKSTLWKDRGVEIEYALFTIEPQGFDYEKAVKEMEDIESKMKDENVETLGQFVSLNSEGKFDDMYYGKGSVRPMELDSFAFAGNIGDMYPIFQEGDTYYVSRIKDIKNLPDSVSAEHILLSPQNASKADSIISEIEKGTSFAKLAAEFSVEPGADVSGGSLGWFDYKSMVRPFSDSCFLNSKKGTIFKVATRFGYHVVRVKDSKDFNKKVQLATAHITVEAGSETSNLFYNKASLLLSECAGDASKMQEAANTVGERLLTQADIDYNTTAIGTIYDAKNLVRWACSAKEGELSKVIDVDGLNKYVVARVKSVREKGIEPFKSAKTEMERLAMQEKKAERIESELAEAFKSSTTIDDFAGKANANVVSSTSPITLASTFIPSLPMSEPKLIGAISASQPNKLTGPIRGEYGVYVLMVTSLEENSGEDLEFAKANLFNSRLGETNLETNKVLLKVGDFVDNRGKFY